MSTEQKLHYHLVYGTVTFFEEGKEDQGVGTTSLNTIITTEVPLITTKDLGRAQQGLQMQLHSRTQGVAMNVVDVQIVTINNLGLMEPKEFLNVPAPTVQ
ncbi:MAG: hypothetical protein WC117_00140 [Sphaerochaetaceae bacterium]|jgi:hypothetical protein